IGATSTQRHDVIAYVAWAAAPGLAGGWAWVLPLELSGRFSQTRLGHISQQQKPQHRQRLVHHTNLTVS
ncbi:MAG TPA: hypothetical protein VFP79_12325, partial [Pseudolabrys sp.]|nr:hypothetical protein [Pseudolabrys sp.]